MMINLFSSSASERLWRYLLDAQSLIALRAWPRSRNEAPEGVVVIN